MRVLQIMCAAAALGAMSLAAGCAKDPVTGQERLDLVAVVDGLALAGSVLAIITDSETPAPDLMDLATNGVEEGIAKFCRLDAFDQATVRRQLDARDPALRPYLIARYGGIDGDVCTADPPRPPGPLSDPDRLVAPGLTPGGAAS